MEVDYPIETKGKRKQARWLKKGDLVNFGNCLEAVVERVIKTPSVVIVELKGPSGKKETATLPPLIHIGIQCT
jgi:hypothetical protein